MKATTSTQAGYYDANAAERDNNTYNLEEAVQNFANATTTDRAAFENLIQTNQRLEEQMANLI